MSKPPAIQTRKFRRGEEIYSGSSRPTHIYVVQSGLVSVSIIKEDCAQLHLVGPMQTLREEALLAGPASGTSAIAIRDTQVIEIPLEAVQPLIAAAPSPLATLTKGLLERLKGSSGELRSLKINRDAHPCPADFTAKVFGVLFYSARYVGKKQEDFVVADWKALEAYAVQVFHEYPVRIEEAVLILAKLGYADVWVGTEKKPRPIPPSNQWTQVCFRNMGQLESFFDFYQNYHFKGGYAALLKTNEKATELTQALVRLADKYKSDRGGMVALPYKATIDTLKDMLGKTFEAEQIFRLEQKGLMVKRVTTQDGGSLTFYKPEFEQMLLTWKILREVELWNIKGYVHMPEEPAPGAGAEGAASTEKSPEAEQMAAVMESWKPLVLTGGTPVLRTEPARRDEIFCPVCMSSVQGSQTYCPVCDCELPKAA